MRFLSNFGCQEPITHNVMGSCGCKIIFMHSVNFWHQQASNSLFKGSVGHVTSLCKWPILLQRISREAKSLNSVKWKMGSVECRKFQQTSKFVVACEQALCLVKGRKGGHLSLPSPRDFFTLFPNREPVHRLNLFRAVLFLCWTRGTKLFCHILAKIFPQNSANS